MILHPYCYDPAPVPLWSPPYSIMILSLWYYDPASIWLWFHPCSIMIPHPYGYNPAPVVLWFCMCTIMIMILHLYHYDFTRLWFIMSYELLKIHISLVKCNELYRQLPVLNDSKWSLLVVMHPNSGTLYMYVWQVSGVSCTVSWQTVPGFHKWVSNSLLRYSLPRSLCNFWIWMPCCVLSQASNSL
jgi:hypothetical protein